MLVRTGDQIKGLTTKRRKASGVVVEPLPHETRPDGVETCRVLTGDGARVWVVLSTIEQPPWP